MERLVFPLTTPLTAPVAPADQKSCSPSPLCSDVGGEVASQPWFAVMPSAEDLQLDSSLELMEVAGGDDCLMPPPANSSLGRQPHCSEPGVVHSTTSNPTPTSFDQQLPSGSRSLSPKPQLYLTRLPPPPASLPPHDLLDEHSEQTQRSPSSPEALLPTDCCFGSSRGGIRLSSVDIMPMLDSSTFSPATDSKAEHAALDSTAYRHTSEGSNTTRDQRQSSAALMAARQQMDCGDDGRVSSSLDLVRALHDSGYPAEQPQQLGTRLYESLSRTDLQTDLCSPAWYDEGSESSLFGGLLDDPLSCGGDCCCAAGQTVGYTPTHALLWENAHKQFRAGEDRALPPLYSQPLPSPAQRALCLPTSGVGVRTSSGGWKKRAREQRSSGSPHRQHHKHRHVHHHRHHSSSSTHHRKHSPEKRSRGHSRVRRDTTSATDDNDTASHAARLTVTHTGSEEAEETKEGEMCALLRSPKRKYAGKRSRLPPAAEDEQDEETAAHPGIAHRAHTTSSTSSSSAVAASLTAAVQKYTENGERLVDIRPYLSLPQQRAAGLLGVNSSILSKRWRVAAHQCKWPYRMLCKLDHKLTAILMQYVDTPNDPLPSWACEEIDKLVARRNELLTHTLVPLPAPNDKHRT
jgi:hypothetical protein